ncbi:acyltransferase [Enterococcus faecium]|uniref:acyltransferase n=1 Tax=Enterococcus faecium TaxID=1352 RepID=UPI002281387F|nr:DapH/DapD/GlmU-related protein [Enterococcus faecium]MCU1817702.1 hypothetical protein [Enterococcus faecium]MCY7002398.1 DapH/DapD/GlmU-related protein [Enterococcus faecium]HAP8953298.1 hypothetical protein [Enterococcus faecium]
MYTYHPGGIVKIRNNVFVGENATILRNVTVGNNCIIAAGAVVTSDIPNNSVCAGIPAKLIMSMDSYYKKRKESLMDEALVPHV